MIMIMIMIMIKSAIAGLRREAVVTELSTQPQFTKHQRTWHKLYTRLYFKCENRQRKLEWNTSVIS